MTAAAGSHHRAGPYRGDRRRAAGARAL